MPSSELMCLVISLERSKERRKSIASTLGSLGLSFQFVDAVDASQGFDARVESDILRTRGGTISDGEFACALSHRTAYDTLLASDCSHALILEDDAIPSSALARFCLEELYREYPMQLLFHSRARVIRSKGIPLLADSKAYPLALSCTGAVAYTIDRVSAGALRRANTPVRFVADWPIDISALGARVLQPMIVGHPVRSGGQSLLSPERAANSRTFNATRWLSRRYLRRKWLKWTSTRIS